MKRALLLACLIAGGAMAQDYPTKPVRIVTPYAPGGPTELVSRLMAEGLTKRLGQPFVVEARPGAATQIGTEAVKQAPADGYTLLLLSTPFSTNHALFKNIPYETSDFRAIVQMVTVPTAFWVNASSPIKSVPELVAAAKAKPGTVTVGTAGNGTSTHLTLELLGYLTNAEFVHVPFKGDSPAITELLASRISASINPLGVPLPHARAGKLRAISINIDRRVPQLPDTPTLAEQGLKEATSSTWFGLGARAQVPTAIVERINTQANQVLAQEDVKSKLADVGMITVGGTAEQFDTHIKAETQRWGTVIRARGIKVE